MTARHLYVHVPFCARRCSYCDFAIAVRREVPVREYLDSILRELDQKRLGGSTLDSLYLGGGTPSRLGGAGLRELVGVMRDRFVITPETEITIEANPDDVTDGDAQLWLEAGINRISLGVQSFDDSVLAWMHRIHDAESAIEAFSTLRRAGFDNISIDLIFALPSSLGRNWENDLDRAFGLAPDHISLYGLTIEPHTPLSRWRDRGAVVAVDEELYAEDFLLADRVAAKHGYEHYEVSNFALPGKRSRHNSAYWTGAAYAGVGPSAHSFDGSARRWNVREYAEWRERLSNGDSVVEASEVLTEENRLSEKVYLGLRTNAGLEVSGRDRESAELWARAGWAKVNGNVVRLTSEGWLRLDSLAAALTGI